MSLKIFKDKTTVVPGPGGNTEFELAVNLTHYVHPLDVAFIRVSGAELGRALYLTGLQEDQESDGSMMFYGDWAKHVVGNW